MISKSRRDSVGGGVVAVAECFRGLRKPTRFSGGGGSRVLRIFPFSPKEFVSCSPGPDHIELYSLDAPKIRISC